MTKFIAFFIALLLSWVQQQQVVSAKSTFLKQQFSSRRRVPLVHNNNNKASSMTVAAEHIMKDSHSSVDNNDSSLISNNIVSLRGGACSDSNPELFLKLFLSAALEAVSMLAVIVGSTKLADAERIPNVFGLSVLVWAGLFLVVFASSFFGAVVDGGLSTATNQVLAPNHIPGDSNWYEKLKKPSWNPPGWLFPIMWLVVSKPTQVIAVSKILKSGNIDSVIGILAIYCVHLSLGDTWNKVFFGLQCTGRGAAVITVFWAVLLISAYLFYTVDPSAGYFLLPTCGWVTVAAALTWNIYLQNKDKKKSSALPGNLVLPASAENFVLPGALAVAAAALNSLQNKNKKNKRR